ncbi:MAG: ISL3 family transposase [Dissulfurimicrobium sp.]|uniref:ISL3 family transposase n=1 Tax=Dissulfurimicrobium TaxID=1769732 RepID=UPI001EDADD10|nr:ISL3 family transposase [Dissulfurimicrobium hydrothermale]UKL14582.1 ISL3 family transposase [Dissulfurimicrobium hydrothermale]
MAGQTLDTGVEPHQLKIRIQADRGAEFPCPECGRMCKAHDFHEKTWRHLNFFQHHCYITASVPRTDCPEHGVKMVRVPWARSGNRFTLLFEQAAMLLVREMPVSAATRIVGTDDKTLWRIVFHYVNQAMSGLDLSAVQGIAVDETAVSRGHHYVTVFIDLDRKDRPVLFATEGKGKETIEAFERYLEGRNGKAENIARVVCDMSKAFISGSEERFGNAVVVVDWFHVVQLFNRAVDEVRRRESVKSRMPRGTRWTLLKASDGGRLTEKQRGLLDELEGFAVHTAKAWRIKEMLRWVKKAEFSQGAKWRLTHFLNYAHSLLNDTPILRPVFKAIETVKRHRDRILNRWGNDYTNARLEGLNGIFQAARARARGYRNVQTFVTMIYLLAAPLGDMLKIHTK